jgi:outer membrane protein
MIWNIARRSVGLTTAALCAVAFLSPAGIAQESSPVRKLTLEEAVKLALEKQPQVQIARSQTAISRAQLVQTASSYYPQLTPSVDYTSSRASYRIGGLTSTTVRERSEASIGLSQLLFDMGKREANVSAARSTVAASDYGLQSTRQAIVLSVTTAYYELLRRRELLRVEQASVDRAKTTYDATRAFAEEGTVRQIDVLQAEADYRNAVVQLGIATNDVRLGEASLRNAIGLSTNETVTASDITPAWPDEKPDPQPVAAYVTKAFNARPDLKQSLAQVEAYRAAARIARINARPAIEANLTAGYRFDPDPGPDDMLVASLSFPLFDGGASRAKIRSADENVKQALQDLELSRQDIHLSVEDAYLSREEARQRVTASRTAVDAAKANYDAASAGYKEGVQTVVDVITAQAQLVTAETNLVQSLYDFHTSDARLQRAIGDNDPYWTGGRK